MRLMAQLIGAFQRLDPIWRGVGGVFAFGGAVLTALGLWNLVPNAQPDLAVAGFVVTQSGAKRLMDAAVIEAKVDLSNPKETYASFPLRLALINNDSRLINNVRVQLIYDESLEIRSTSLQKILKSGDVAYEVSLAAIDRNEGVVFLPIDDVLSIKVGVLPTEVISLMADDIPMFSRLVFVFPYDFESAQAIAERTKSLRHLAGRELAIRAVIKSVEFPDVAKDFEIALPLEAELVYPNVRSTIEWRERGADDWINLAGLLACAPIDSWERRSPDAGGVISYKRCELAPGVVQIASYRHTAFRYILDEDGDGEVDIEYLDYDGDAIPEKIATVVSGSYPMIPWPADAVR